MNPSGFMDTRSNPDEIELGGHRWVLNWEKTHRKKLCRMTGWQKLQSAPIYNNEDLHDQLVGDGIRQPFNFLFQVKTSGFSKLFAGTQNRLFSKNNSTGNWQVISSQLGGDATQDCVESVWTAGHVGDIVVFSNNRDQAVYHIVDQALIDGASQGVSVIPDLVRLKVTKVGLVVAWNNLMLYCNLEQDGRRYSNRVMWSDLKRPLSVYPDADNSLAGATDLPSNEVILAAEPMVDALLLYTTSGIWEVRITGGDDVLSFIKRYVSDKAGSKCLAYKRTLVAVGSNHYYCGRDGVYLYNFYLPEPELVPWIDKASSVIFSDINASMCNVHCAGYFPEKRQVWISWAREDENCPGMTFVIGTEHQFTSFVDKGFTAFCNYEPDYNRSIRDFILEQCICTKAEIVALGKEFVNEGGYCYTEIAQVCNDRPTTLISNQDRNEGGITVEDWDNITPDSLVHRLAAVFLSELCADEFTSGDCNTSELFVMADADDWCLKELANVTHREVCTSFALCGTYVRIGYQSRLLSGAIALQEPNKSKVIDAFIMELHPGAAVEPADIVLIVGSAVQALDPLTAVGNCNLFWEEQDPKLLKCLDDQSVEENRADGVAPDENFGWPLYIKAKYFYYDIIIRNPRSNPVDTGGEVCVSRLAFDAHRDTTCA